MHTVLVADDDPRMCDLVILILQDAGYRVLSTVRGWQAIDLATRHHPDLALIDVRMADLEGFAVCRALKATPETMDLPIIFLTAVHDHAVECEGLACGAVDYVTKPYAPEVLVERVRRVIAERERRTALLVENAWLRQQLASVGSGSIGGAEAPDAAAHDHKVAQPHLPLSMRGISLSATERAILAALVAGYKQSEIALMHNVSLRTLERQIAVLKIKLDVPTLAALIAGVLEHHLLS